MVLRMSKLEKVGHIEWKARQLYHVPTDIASRLWGKTQDTDIQWRPLFRRHKPIGKVLELDSDFLRSPLLLELCASDGTWVNTPSETAYLPEGGAEVPASGRLYDQSIFDDVTSGWEHDIHQQIGNFSLHQHKFTF